MPSSGTENITAICDLISDLKPKSILDIGIGFGKWGMLTREYTDIRNGDYWEWKIRIDGIEIFEKYRNPVWGVYDKVYIGNALDVIQGLGQYDLILICHVVEHFNFVDGHKLLSFCCKKGKTVIISTPNGYMQQGPILGNVNESHLSSWTIKDFGNAEVKINGEKILAVYKKQM